MKNIIKRILNISLVSLIASTLFINVGAKEELRDSEFLKIYDIKEKDEVILDSNKVIAFYEETHEEIQILIEEKREQERIAEEKRLEEERIAEQKRLEEERRRQYSNYAIHTMDHSDSEIANFALQFVGNPYVYGGTSLTEGADCSGFVQAVYANFEIYVPRTAPEQAYYGQWVSLDSIQPGDIVSYTFDGVNPGHSALYLGEGLIIHASVPELGIRIDNLYSMPIYGVRRVI